MVCKNCGAELSNDTKICTECHRLVKAGFADIWRESAILRKVVKIGAPIVFVLVVVLCLFIFLKDSPVVTVEQNRIYINGPFEGEDVTIYLTPYVTNCSEGNTHIYMKEDALEFGQKLHFALGDELQDNYEYCDFSNTQSGSMEEYVFDKSVIAVTETINLPGMAICLSGLYEKGYYVPYLEEVIAGRWNSGSLECIVNGSAFPVLHTIELSDGDRSLENEDLPKFVLLGEFDALNSVQIQLPSDYLHFEGVFPSLTNMRLTGCEIGLYCDFPKLERIDYLKATETFSMLALKAKNLKEIYAEGDLGIAVADYVLKGESIISNYDSLEKIECDLLGFGVDGELDWDALSEDIKMEITVNAVIEKMPSLKEIVIASGSADPLAIKILKALADKHSVTLIEK